MLIVIRNRRGVECGERGNLRKSSFFSVAQMRPRFYLFEVRNIFRTEYMPSAFLKLSFYFFTSEEEIVIDKNSLGMNGFKFNF